MMWNICVVLFIILGLSQQSVVIGGGRRRLNRTRPFFRQQFDTEFDNDIAWAVLSQSNSPSIIKRDIAYLLEDDYNDNSDEVETTIEDGIESESPQQVLERVDRNLRPEYRSLCEIKTRKVQLSDSEYEYQPQHYLEIYCKSYSLLDRTDVNSLKPHPRQLCAHPGFHCIQRSRTISLVRRRWFSDSSECWEPYTKKIASGCDCMWPVSTLGDIMAHY